ncbi:MAG: hypothetical protein JNK81_01405 [Anaerolineales bacterium]|nr:hypothetical protein [Anaerolineales bacterium]
MKTIAILNDVHDADYVVQHRTQFDSMTLISTHAAVDDYLEAHGLFCTPLSSFLTITDLMKLNKEAATKIDALLNHLDSLFADELNQQLQITPSLQFFYTLYRYRGKLEYVNISKSIIAMERLLDKFSLQKAILFMPHGVQNAPSFFQTTINIMELILSCTSLAIEKITSPISQKILVQSKKNSRRQKWNKIFANGIRSGFSKLYKNVFKKNGFQDAPLALRLENARGLLVLINGSHSAELISPSHLSSKNISFQENLSAQKMLPSQNLQEAKQEAVKEILSKNEIEISAVLRAIFLDDFCRNYFTYVLPVKNLHHLASEEKILGGIWIRPPVAINGLSFLVEYLLKCGVPVIGRQHGGNYGIEVSPPRHFDSDFWWSTHYLSYGFTKEDLRETSPDLQPRCEIIPAGEKVTVDSHHFSTHVKIDILFPISNAASFYREGPRPLLHELAQYQRELLKFLNQFSNLHVVVKPFPGYDYTNSAFIELLHGLKNIKILEGLSLVDVLKEYPTRVILSEFPSSPLFECLKTDAEILSLTNPLLPFNPTAYQLLSKRVHFYDTLSEMKQGITDCLEGHLPIKRDDSFANKYLLPASPEKIKITSAQILGIE